MFSEDYASLGTFFLLFVQIVPAFCPVCHPFAGQPRQDAHITEIRLARILFQLKSWGMARDLSGGYSGRFVKLMAYGDDEDWRQLYPVVPVLCPAAARIPVRGQALGVDDIAPAPTLAETVKVGVPGIRQGCVLAHAVPPCCPPISTSVRAAKRKATVRRKIACSGQWRCWSPPSCCILPANILPIAITDLLGDKMPSTILAGVILLWAKDLIPVAGVIFYRQYYGTHLKMIATGSAAGDAKGARKRDSERCISRRGGRVCWTLV